MIAPPPPHVPVMGGEPGLEWPFRIGRQWCLVLVLTLFQFILKDSFCVCVSVRVQCTCACAFVCAHVCDNAFRPISPCPLSSPCRPVRGATFSLHPARQWSVTHTNCNQANSFRDQTQSDPFLFNEINQHPQRRRRLAALTRGWVEELFNAAKKKKKRTVS